MERSPFTLETWGGKGIAAAMYAALVMGMLRGITKTDEQTSPFWQF
jgi:hypothetical protein